MIFNIVYIPQEQKSQVQIQKEQCLNEDVTEYFTTKFKNFLQVSTSCNVQIITHINASLL